MVSQSVYVACKNSITGLLVISIGHYRLWCSTLEYLEIRMTKLFSWFEKRGKIISNIVLVVLKVIGHYRTF